MPHHTKLHDLDRDQQADIEGRCERVRTVVLLLVPVTFHALVVVDVARVLFVGTVLVPVDTIVADAHILADLVLLTGLLAAAVAVVVAPEDAVGVVGATS